jgi:small subunit ribosomal protein S13
MEKPNENFKYIVRVGSADIDGKKHLLYSLRKIKGVNFMFANAICEVGELDKQMKAGDLTDSQISKINDIVKEPLKFGIPLWALNRKNDYETGEDMHLMGGDLTFTQDNDIKRLRKIKTYIGVRHSRRLPVRGQRTKSNFRKNKGKSVGVKKKK